MNESRKSVTHKGSALEYFRERFFFSKAGKSYGTLEGS